MRFSIIIPAYCAENTLYNCLLSVRQQSFSDFEAIIVDDGSKDNTPRIAQDFAATDQRFRYICQENQGVSAARNCGISHAQGDFVVFLDSDDKYDRDYLLDFQKMTLAYPECDHFWCGYKSISVADATLGEYILPLVNDINVVDRSSIMDLREHGLDSPLWNKLFRRQIINTYNLNMLPTLSLGEDLLFNYAYLDISRPSIVIINKPLYIYTKAENDSLDSKYRVDLLEIYTLINAQIFEYLLKWNLRESQMSKYYNGVLYSMERVLRNTYRTECQMTAKEKVRYNNNVLRSKQFKEALSQSDCYIHPLYRFAYTIGSWELVSLLNKMHNYKSSR